MAKIAFWMPVYNEAKFLRKTIESVLAQTYPNFDLIISNNFSTDESNEIIQEFASSSTNVTLWAPPEHCPSLDHFFFFWEKLKQTDYDFYIHIGGHDLINANYAESLVNAWRQHPAAAVVCGTGLALAKNDEMRGEYAGKTPQLIGPYRLFNPFSIITLTSSNAAIHGLIPAELAKKLNFRYKCPGVDVLFVAELSTYGDVIYVPEAIIQQRISEGGTAEYMNKHMGANQNNPDALIEVLNMQMQYIRDIAEHACQGFPADLINIYTSSLMGTYFIKWCANDYMNGSLVHLGDIVSLYLGQMSFIGGNAAEKLTAYFAAQQANTATDK